MPSGFFQFQAGLFFAPTQSMRRFLLPSLIKYSVLVLAFSQSLYAAPGAKSCAANLGFVSAKSTAHLSPEAQKVQAILDQEVPEIQMQQFKKRWHVLDRSLRIWNWEAFYEGAQSISPAARQAFEEIQFKRMSPSSTISAMNHQDLNFDQAEVNWRAADRMIHEWVKAGLPITVERMFLLNKQVGEKLFFNGNIPGRKRTNDVGVQYEKNGREWFQSALHAKNIDQMLIHFMGWYNSHEGKMHPIQLAAQVYQRLNTIHPFPDGNGRTTRLIMDWILRRNGLTPGIFKSVEGTYAVVFPNDLLGRNPAPGFIEEQVTAGMEWVAETLESAQHLDSTAP